MAEATRGIGAAFVLWPAGVGPIAKTTIPLLQALEAAGCRRVVFLSVFGAGTLKFLPHVAVERWLADSSLDHTILRAGYFMQNLSTTHRVDVCEHNEIFIPAGGGHLAMVDTRDIAEVACHELLTPTKPRATYELTGADTINFHEAAEVFSQVLDRPIAYRAPGLWAFARRWRTRDVDRTLLAFMLVEYAVTRLDRSGRVSPDLEQLLGRKPRKLADFVRDHRDLFAAAPPA